MKVAIIGSGLAAVSATKVLISRGIKPIILDKGEILDSERTSSMLVHSIRLYKILQKKVHEFKAKFRSAILVHEKP